MDDEKILTKEIAEQFLAGEDSVDLNEFTSLEDDAADLLGTYSGSDLFLFNIKNFSVTAAKGLARYGGTLTIDVSNASDQAIAELSKASNEGLNLWGVRNLTAGTAEILSSFEGMLTLADLDSLTEEVAEKLSNQTHTLQLGPLKEITPEVCKILSRYQGDSLFFDELVSLSSDCAKHLSAYEGYLTFFDTKRISDSAAGWLSKKKGGGIGFFGLKFISAKTRALFEECEVTIDAPWDDLMTFESVKEVCKHFDYDADSRI